VVIPDLNAKSGIEADAVEIHTFACVIFASEPRKLILPVISQLPAVTEIDVKFVDVAELILVADADRTSEDTCSPTYPTD